MPRFVSGFSSRPKKASCPRFDLRERFFFLAIDVRILAYECLFSCAQTREPVSSGMIDKNPIFWYLHAFIER